MIQKTYPITEQLIHNALQLAQQLQQELVREADVIKNHQQVDQISNIATGKKLLAAQMEQFSNQLSQVLATEKLPNSPDSVKEYFTRATNVGLSTVKASEEWNLLMQVCRDCKYLNEQNGASIELLARHTKRSLDILKGKPDQINTYGSDGSTQSDRYSRPLISV